MVSVTKVCNKPAEECVPAQVIQQLVCSLTTDGVFAASMQIEANDSTFIGWSWQLKLDGLIVAGTLITDDTLNDFDFGTLNAEIMEAGTYQLCIQYISECDGDESTLTAECSFVLQEDCDCDGVTLANVDFTTDGGNEPCDVPTVSELSCSVSDSSVSVSGGVVSDPTGSATGPQTWALTGSNGVVMSGTGVPTSLDGLSEDDYVLQITLPYDCEGIGSITVDCGFEVIEPPCQVPTISPLICSVNGDSLSVVGGVISDPSSAVTSVTWQLVGPMDPDPTGSGVPTVINDIDPGSYTLLVTVNHSCSEGALITALCNFEIDDCVASNFEILSCDPSQVNGTNCVNVGLSGIPADFTIAQWTLTNTADSTQTYTSPQTIASNIFNNNDLCPTGSQGGTPFELGVYLLSITVTDVCGNTYTRTVQCPNAMGESPLSGPVNDQFASAVSGSLEILDPLANDDCGPNTIITDCYQICPVTGEPWDTACSECQISADGKTIEFTGSWFDANHTITYEYTVDDPDNEKTGLIGRMEIPVAFKPMKQFMMQVTTAGQMASLTGAGWEWGFHSFGDTIALAHATTADPSGMTGYLAAAAANGGYAAVSIKPNWFSSTAGTSLSAAGVAAVAAIQADYAGPKILCGMHMESGDFPTAGAAAAQVTLEAALSGPEAELLGGYQVTSTGSDHYYRLWIPLRDNSSGTFGELGEIVERRHDPFATFPVQVMVGRGLERTPDCKPKAGVKTGGFMGQCLGKLLPTPACEFTPGDPPTCTSTGSVDNVWDVTDGQTGTNGNDLGNYIRPGRGHFDHMIWTAHRICAIHFLWFTSTANGQGGVLATANTLNQHSPDNFEDLVHVLKKYEQGPKQIYETWPADYQLRNHYVTVSQPGD